MATNSKITDITVHCSATSPNTSATVKDISRWHAQRGFIAPAAGQPICGYHWVIQRDGVIEKGRNEQYVGAHVANHNTNNLGICLAGGVDKDGPDGKPVNNFTLKQFAALEALIGDIRKRHGNVPVRGHRDWPNVAKACPSFDVEAWLKTTSLGS